MTIETVQVGAFQVNCYIVWKSTPQALVIDPGADAALILGALDTRDLRPAAYLLTHGHMDHVSALRELLAVHPAPVSCHPSDLAWAFSEQNAYPPYYPAPTLPPGVEKRIFKDGQAWTDAGLSYRIIETPGHTAGSVCLYFEEDGMLFSGDTLFAGSVGRTDLSGGDARALTRSLALLAKLPDATRVLAGHGDPTDIGHEKRTNYFMRGK
jgi:hydroxyacylglutathione hydrolase